MVVRNAFRIAVVAAGALTRAFTRAVRQEFVASQQAAAAARRGQQAGQNGSETQQASQTSARLGMSLQEAMKILDVQDPLNAKEVETSYRHLFAINDKTKGGSLYLQSKVYRAKERIDEAFSQRCRPRPDNV